MTMSANTLLSSVDSTCAIASSIVPVGSRKLALKAPAFGDLEAVDSAAAWGIRKSPALRAGLFAISGFQIRRLWCLLRLLNEELSFFP